MDRRIVIVNCSNDWQGLYVDGVLAAEGPLTPGDVLAALGMNHAKCSADPAWFKKIGESLPMNLKDIERA